MMWPFTKPKREESEAPEFSRRPNYDRVMGKCMMLYDNAAAVRDFHIRLLRLEGKTAEADALEAKTFGPQG